MFGDSNIDTLVDFKSRSEYEPLLFVFDIKQQSFQPIRVIATSSTCLNHFFTIFQTEAQTIPPTICHQFSVLGEILPSIKIWNKIKTLVTKKKTFGLLVEEWQ